MGRNDHKPAESHPEVRLQDALSAVFCAIALAVAPFVSCAQTAGRLPSTEYPWETFVEEYQEYADELAEEGDGVTRYDWLEELEEIHRQRLDLNAVGRDELLQLHFLSEAEADSILARRDSLGGFRDISDLMTVRSLNFITRAWLSVFVCFGPTAHAAERHPAENLMRHRRHAGNRWWSGQHSLDAQAAFPLCQRAGFADYDAENYARKMFLGSNFSHRLRYRYAWNQHVKYGLTLEQDVGERMAAYGARIWDAGSAYFYYKADARLREGERRAYSPCEIVVGDYRLRLAEGLVVGHCGWGNTSALLGNVRMDRGRMSPCTGGDGRRHLRGAAVRLRGGHEGAWNAIVFASCREMDGTVKGADEENGFDKNASDTITAWKTDGLHRTLQEAGKRRVARQIVGGARWGYDARTLSIGLNAAGLWYDRTYFPAYRTYNQYYLRGRSAAAISLDWGVQWGKCMLVGEVAADPVRNVRPQMLEDDADAGAATTTDYRKRCALAATTTLRWQPRWNFLLVANVRAFSRDFVSPFGETVQAGSILQNEEGASVALRLRPATWLLLMAYADLAHHRYPTYQAKLPALQMEAMGQGVVEMGSGWMLTAAYKLTSREANITGKDLPLLEWKSTHKVKLYATLKRTLWSLTCGGESVVYTTQTGQGQHHGRFSRGGALYVRSRVMPWRWLRLSGALGGFLTDDYFARCYLYSPQLQIGGTGSTAYYGRGLTATALAEATLWRGLSLAARYGLMQCYDRDELGEGINAIHSGRKSDVAIELRWKF